MKNNEYRPRIRISRRHPVSRKGCFVLAVCETELEAQAIELLLQEIFTKAKSDEEKETKAEVERQYEALVIPEGFVPEYRKVQNVKPEAA